MRKITHFSPLDAEMNSPVRFCCKKGRSCGKLVFDWSNAKESLLMNQKTPFKWRHARLRDHFALRAVIPALLAQLSRPGGNDATTGAAGSTPQGCPVEEQMEEPTTPPDPNATKSAPRVITVDTNAAYPKAEASLKAAGILAERVELKPDQRLEEPDRARPLYWLLGTSFQK